MGMCKPSGGINEPIYGPARGTIEKRKDTPNRNGRFKEIKKFRWGTTFKRIFNLKLKENLEF